MSGNAKYQVVLDSLSAIMKRGGDRTALLREIAATLRQVGDHYSWAGIYLLEGEDLVLAAWHGPQATEHTRIPLGEGICGLAAASGELVNVPDVGQDSRYLMCFPSTKSEIVVPIAGPGGLLGEIDVDSDMQGAFDEEDEAFLRAVARQLAKVLAP